MRIDIKEIQKIEVDILKQILTICENNHIHYFMLGGTLLGAIRHKDFIPWDDDIDIGMPRPDYERFIRIAQKELKDPYAISTIDNGGYYYYPRVVNKNVKLLRKRGQHDTVINAWVDVFPLDGVPNDEKTREKWNKKVQRAKRLFWYSQFDYFMDKQPQPGETWSLQHRVLMKISMATKWYKLINKKKAWTHLDHLLTKYDYDACDRLINYLGYWDLKEMFPKSVYQNGKLYPFGDLMLYGPVDYDYVLKQMYGDYMTPPKDANKEHHMIEILDEE